MMKFHPAITKDLKKTYGLVASAALRAMTPEGKWAIKSAMHPYNAAKRDVAAKIAKYKFDQGLEPRKGFRGRVRYWNELVNLPMDDPLMYPKTHSTIQSKISTNPAYTPTGEWAATSYAEYKAALKARLKAQMKARQEAISKMSADEYKTYRYRVKALNEARREPRS